MGNVAKDARAIGRAVASIALGLAMSVSGAASGPESDSTASHPPGSASPAAGWGGIGDAGGGFRVTPTRIVFDDRLRSAELTLVNTGTEPATYRVSLVRMRMSVSGAIAEVVDPLPDEAFADSLVRYSPRQ